MQMMLHFVFDGNFQVQAPRGAYIWRGDLTKGVFAFRSLGGLYLEGLIFGILRYLVKRLIVMLRCAVNNITSSFQHFP